MNELKEGNHLTFFFTFSLLKLNDSDWTHLIWKWEWEHQERIYLKLMISCLLNMLHYFGYLQLQWKNEYLGKWKRSLLFMKTFIDIMQYILTYFLTCTICFVHKSNFLLYIPYFIFIVNKIIFFHDDLLVLSIKLAIDPKKW